MLNGMRIEVSLWLVHVDFRSVNVVVSFIWVSTNSSGVAEVLLKLLLMGTLPITERAGWVSQLDFGLSLGGFAPFEIIWPVREIRNIVAYLKLNFLPVRCL